jgi:hypothetical protein
MHLLRSRAVATAVLLFAACTSPRESNPPVESVGSSTDVHLCGMAGLSEVSPDSAAVRCAEWFIARNGYTDLLPADTALLAGESLEETASWSEALAERRNTLGRHAVVLCRGARGRPGYTVAFVAPGDTALRSGRAVMMNADFSGLVVQHQGFAPIAALADPARCAALRRAE